MIPNQSQTDLPHTILHTLLVFDVPCIGRAGSDDLLSVMRFASCGEVLSGPRRLEIKSLGLPGAFKDPL